MSENARNKGRMAIYSMAGVYLLFMAYNLIKELPYSSGNQKILSIVFVIFFGVVGAGMVIMGLVQGYKLSSPSNAAASKELPETKEAADEDAGVEEAAAGTGAEDDGADGGNEEE